MELCEKWREIAMSYLDNELDPERRKAFEGHLASCATCARVFQEYRQVKEMTQKMKLPRSQDASLWAEYPKGVMNRLSQGLGWTLLIPGAVLLVLYSLYEFLSCPAAAIPKICIFAVLMGLVLLLVSVIRTRYQESKTDRYSKEVER